MNRRSFFGGAFGGFLAALGLRKEAKGCGSPHCYRPGCWTGPRPTPDIDAAIKRAAQALADDWDAQIYAKVYGTVGVPTA